MSIARSSIASQRVRERGHAPLAAITGATGFAGGALARRLLLERYHVRALVREPDRLRAIHPHLTTTTGTLADRGALDELVRGAELVVHVAAMFRTEGPPRQFYDVNHVGTRNLLEAAQAAGVRRFVHCSTIGVHGNVTAEPADETAPLKPSDHYQKSKLLAEEACRETAARGGMEVVILRPCGIYGPGDRRMLKLFRLLAHGSFVMVGAGRANFHPVFIDDLVDAFIAAAHVPGAAGETFIVGGPRYLPLADYISIAARTLGCAPPRVRVPFGAMRAAAWVCETLCRPLRLEPPLHRRRLSFFKHNRAFSTTKARSVLGFEPSVDVEEGFRRTIESYRREKLLPDSPQRWRWPLARKSRASSRL